MKVLCTLDFPPERGGIQRYLHELILHTFGKDDVVLAPAYGGARTDDDTIYPCPIVRMSGFLPGRAKKRYLPSLVFALVKLVLKRRASIEVYCGNIYAAVAPWLISYVVKIKYVVYTHGAELLPLKAPDTLRGRMFRSILRKAGVVSYVSMYSRSIMEVSCGKLPYVYAPPKIASPGESIQSLLSAKKSGLIASVGRLVPHKGHAVLLEALCNIDKQKTWECVIAGDGELRKQLDLRIRSGNLGHKVSLLGNCEDATLRKLYRESWIFIFPSQVTAHGFEGFGIALLEAMSYGAAIIASDCGGIPEVFAGATDCVTLVPPGDVAALTDAIVYLLDNSTARLTMAKNARKLLEERYVWNNR